MISEDAWNKLHANPKEGCLYGMQNENRFT